MYSNVSVNTSDPHRAVRSRPQDAQPDKWHEGVTAT
jgi:hypothetical protein